MAKRKANSDRRTAGRTPPSTPSSPAAIGRSSSPTSSARSRSPSALVNAIKSESRRPRLSVHRRSRRRQDVDRPHPGQGAQLRQRPDADAVRRVRKLPGDRRRRRRRRAGNRRRQQPRHRRDSRAAAERAVPARRRSRYKIYIIDEVHMLTQDGVQRPAEDARRAAAARQVHLRHDRSAEDPDHDPVALPAVRFRRHRQRPHRRAAAKPSSPARGCKADDEALELVARRAGGSMRDAQSLLDQLLAFGDERLTVEQVHQMLGTAADDQVDRAGVGDPQHKTSPAALTIVQTGIDAGLQPGELLDQLIGLLARPDDRDFSRFGRPVCSKAPRPRSPRFANRPRK